MTTMNFQTESGKTLEIERINYDGAIILLINKCIVRLKNYNGKPELVGGSDLSAKYGLSNDSIVIFINDKTYQALRNFECLRDIKIESNGWRAGYDEESQYFGRDECCN